MWSERGPLRYERLTWPEVRRAAAEERVALVPVATLRSLAHHGFRRMLFLNGHGSNQNLVEVAARLVMVERPDVLAAAAFYLTSPEAAAAIERVRDSTRGGMAHACELETSIYLAIDPDAVDMDLAVDERGYPEGEHAWLDWSDGSLKLMPWWSAFSRSGVQGDASKATADKGRALLEAAGPRLPGEAGRRHRGARQLRRRRRQGARPRPRGDVRRPRGGRRPVPHRRVRLDAAPAAPGLRGDRRAPQGVLRLLRHHRPARGAAAAGRAGDPDDPYLRPIRGGRASGPLVGGDLWLLLQTMGTPWEVELEGAILFFEEFDAPPWYVDGMLTQLGQAGKLAQLVGVAIGDLEKCDWSEQRPEWPRTKSIEQVLEEHLEPLGVPVLYKLPVGHAKHLATLPLGVTATLDADARTLTVDQPALGPADGG